ncbi:MAG: hypothetical protein ACMXYE_01795 [Candidatus Woesearchaeota archaeon]
MAKTMIQIDTKTRDMIKNLGSMGETYDDVLKRLCKVAVEHTMAKVLLDTTDCVTIDDIMKKRNLC